MRKNKAEKLKKIHIWPVIIYFMMFHFVLGICLMVYLSGMVSNTLSSGINFAYRVTNGIYERLQDKDIYDAAELEKTTAIYTEIMPELKGIHIFDEFGNEIMSYGDSLPDSSFMIDRHFDNVEPISIRVGNASNISPADINIDAFNNVRALIIDQDNELFRINESGSEDEGMILLGIYNDFNQKYIENGGLSDELKITLIKNVWFVYRLDNAYVYAGTDVEADGMDVLYDMIAVFCVAIIAALFVLLFITVLIRFFSNQRRLIKLYYMDIETGGNNWQYFIEHAGKMLRKRRKKDIGYAMVHIRMEKYRSFCSCYGYDAGKKLVSDFYEILRKKIKRGEVLARKDTSDFGILLKYSDKNELYDRVHFFINAMSSARPDIKMYFKAGVCYVNDRKTGASEAYLRASTARASLSEDSIQDIAIFTDEMLVQLMWERQVENDMERALANHEFAVYLQPKYDTRQEKLAAAEALVRWIHPTEGFVPPYKFIPQFEKNGFITKLDDYMLDEVAALQARWLQEGKTVVPISVNVSRAHFTQEDLAEHICAIIDKHSVPHSLIELELTESAFFDDKETLIKIVNRMKELGFVVSMDDFGAGYSSLNSLKELPIDVVKLDAEFFRGNDTAGKGKVIVREAISLAKRLDMRIVAEGIENRDQVDFLAGEECDLIQGFFFAKPMPIDVFEKEYNETSETVSLKKGNDM